jgi:hypothetical protein
MSLFTPAPPSATTNDARVPHAREPESALRPPTTEDVVRLAQAQSPLSVSVLLATVPSAHMLPVDRARLRALVRDAERRLGEESDQSAVDAVTAGLEAAVASASQGPTDRGLAILVSPDESHLHHLRVAPVDRVVIDPTFATRDLVRSAAEDPPFLMLIIDGRAARLFHYGQRYSQPILAHDFPIMRSVDVPPRDSSSSETVDRARRERGRAFLRQVDANLAARVAQAQLPVVLIASDRTVSDFLAVAKTRRIAAIVRSGALSVPLIELEQLAREALAGHVRDRAAAALDTAQIRLAHGRAVAGLEAAWEVLRTGDPDLLVVERTHAPAVRVSDDGLEVVEDAEEVGVIDDAIDDLIEAVLARGADVVTVPDGSLARHDHVVLALRGRVPELAS